MISKDFKININHKNYNGSTIIHIAFKFGNIQIINLLLNIKNLNINEFDQDGYIVLHIASQQGHVEIVKELSKKKINMNILLSEKDHKLKGKYGDTVLHLMVIIKD